MEQERKNHAIWNKAILENEFTCITPPHSNLVQFLGSRKSLKPFLDDEGRDTLGPLLRRRFRVHYQRRSDGTIRDPELVPGEPPPSIDFDCLQGHANDVTATSGFAHCKRADLGPTNEVGEILLLLGVGSPAFELVNA